MGLARDDVIPKERRDLGLHALIGFGFLLMAIGIVMLVAAGAGLVVLSLLAIKWAIDVDWGNAALAIIGTVAPWGCLK